MKEVGFVKYGEKKEMGDPIAYELPGWEGAEDIVKSMV